MTRKVLVACLLFATAVAGCSTSGPDPMSIDSLPPGGSEPDRPRDVPYKEAGSRYAPDRPGTAPRSGISSDPNNPNGAPGTTIGPR